MNDALNQILGKYRITTEEDQMVECPTELANALLIREDEILENILLTAAGLGLAPAITRLALANTGLGMTPEPEAMAMLEVSAQQEANEIAHAQAVMQELWRRFGEES